MKRHSARISKPALLLYFIGLLPALSALPCAAAAQEYPNKPVRIVVPTAAGGSADAAARAIATRMAERLGKPFIVDNRVGAGGVIGTEIVAKSIPDGHTLLGVGAFYGTNPSFYKLSFDPVNAFAPIAKLGSVTMALVVHPSVAASSLQELVALAKQRPGQLLWTSSGIGQTQHMAAELFRLTTGIDVRIVHFKGGGPASIDLLGGHSHVTISSLATMLGHIKSGKLRVLGVCGDKRSPFLPDVPSFAEAGITGYEVSGWWGLLAPAGVPSAVVERLDREIRASLGSEEMKRFFVQQGADADYLGPMEFRAFLVREIALWQRVVKEANISGR